MKRQCLIFLLAIGLSSCEKVGLNSPNSCEVPQESEELISFFDKLVFGAEESIHDTLEKYPAPANIHIYQHKKLGARPDIEGTYWSYGHWGFHSTIASGTAVLFLESNEREKVYPISESASMVLNLTNDRQLLTPENSIAVARNHLEYKIAFGGEAASASKIKSRKDWFGFPDRKLLSLTKQRNNLSIFESFEKGYTDCAYWREESEGKTYYKGFAYVEMDQGQVLNLSNVANCNAALWLFSHGFRYVWNFPPEEILYLYFYPNGTPHIARFTPNMKWAIQKMHNLELGIKNGDSRIDIIKKIKDSERKCS